VILLTVWFLWPLALAIGDVGVAGLDFAAAAIQVLSAGLLVAGFVIALRAHITRADPWRLTEWWDDGVAP